MNWAHKEVGLGWIGFVENVSWKWASTNGYFSYIGAQNWHVIKYVAVSLCFLSFSQLFSFTLQSNFLVAKQKNK